MEHPDPERIRKMFSQVAGGYDKANSILSMGVHHLWRKKLVKLSGVGPGGRVLDCATGTGDLAIVFKKIVGSHGSVLGTDFCPDMLQTAPMKARKSNLKINFETADVTELPYDKDLFDVASIAFGIRNVRHPKRAVSEMARVTRPGGVVMVLEFGQVQLLGFKNIYKIYSEKILPILGGWVTGQREAYQYLQHSSSSFPCREKFAELMRGTDKFSEVSWTPLTGGIAYIYKAVVK